MKLLVAAASLGSALVWGWVHPGARAPTKYQVELRVTGYTGLATSKDCDLKANLAGYDVLTGIVSGDETPQQDEDVEYTGLLKRSTMIDFCITRPAPTVDQVVWCVTRLTGSAVMDVEISVTGSADAGAYVKADPGIGPAQASVQGDCDAADQNQIRQDYPGGESGGSPNGQPITDAFSASLTPNAPAPKFVVAGLARLRVGHYPPDPKLGGWELKVLSKLP